jgi:hypothetical protein
MVLDTVPSRSTTNGVSSALVFDPFDDRIFVGVRDDCEARRIEQLTGRSGFG